MRNKKMSYWIIGTMIIFASMLFVTNEDSGLYEGANEPEVLYETFESGEFNTDIWTVEQGNGHTVTIVEDPTDSSNLVFRAYTADISPDVNPDINPDIRPRAEIWTDLNEEMDTEYWYSWRFMIDEESDHTSANEIIGQWHNEPRNTSFALALELRRDETGENGELDFASTLMHIALLRSGIFPEEGQWHTMTWHIKHSTRPQGFVEAWVDGEPLIPDEGILYGKTAHDKKGSYFKIGSYRYNYTSWENPGTYATGESIVYYDDVKVSKDKNKVDGVPDNL